MIRLVWPTAVCVAGIYTTNQNPNLLKICVHLNIWWLGGGGDLGWKIIIKELVYTQAVAASNRADNDATAVSISDNKLELKVVLESLG
jgi:hypothetical protein